MATIISLNANYKGDARRAGFTSWADMRSGNGTASNFGIRSGWLEDPSFAKELFRSFIAFDTSVIADGALISSVTLKITGTEFWRNDAKDFLITSGTQPSTIVNATYQAHVSTTEYGAYETVSSGSGTSSTNFTNHEIVLNEAGIAAINKTGITKFCVRGDYDFNNNLLMTNDSYNQLDITNATLEIEIELAPLVFNSNLVLSSTVDKQLNKSFLENVKLSSIVNVGNATLISFITNLKLSSNIAKKTFLNLSSNLKLTALLSKISSKIFTSNVKLTSSIVKLAVIPLNFISNLKLEPTIRLIKDGIRVGIWEKVVKLTSDWTKQAKSTSIWSKQDKEI